MKSVLNAQCDFLNFYKYPADIPTAGEYDLPVVKGIRIKHPEKYQLIAFDECHLIPEKDRKKYIVHFYIYDYKFERVWTYLKKYTEWLKQFAAVIAPDFSQYTDMPKAMQIWNAYRINFVAWWWQNNGVKVIPNAYWSDEQSLGYAFDGMPEGSCICVSAKCCYVEDKRIHKLSKQEQDSISELRSKFKTGVENLVHLKKPSQILWFGPIPEWVNDLVEYYNIKFIRIRTRKLYAERLSVKS